jgi:2-polyprenyl-3-methyl-5-hydroxy-6-metoxy-1,4-benzoquinol methylase
MPLYSKQYVEELKWLHAKADRPRGFGGKIKPLGAFYSFYEKWQPKTVLDYGCGKGAILNHLRETLPSTIWHGYDPAVDEFRKIMNAQYNCVFSNDVLEHIEPNCLDSVLDHIWSLAEKNLWLRIDTKPARKTLMDGRNAHLILEDKDWWTNKLSQRAGKIVYIELGKKGKLDVAIEK